MPTRGEGSEQRLSHFQQLQADSVHSTPQMPDPVESASPLEGQDDGQVGDDDPLDLDDDDPWGQRT